MLADRQTEDVCGLREGESIDGDIVGGDSLLRKWELLEYIGLEDWTRACIALASVQHITSGRHTSTASVDLVSSS